jgi:hypothetical protein
MQKVPPSNSNRVGRTLNSELKNSFKVAKLAASNPPTSSNNDGKKCPRRTAEKRNTATLQPSNDQSQRCILPADCPQGIGPERKLKFFSVARWLKRKMPQTRRPAAFYFDLKLALGD